MNLSTRQFNVDPKLQQILPVLNSEQVEQLTQGLLDAGRCLSPLVVWDEENILLDGHYRWEILQRHSEISYEIERLSLGSREEAIKWIFLPP